MKITSNLKALAGTIKTNFVEAGTLTLLLFGLPLIAFMYADIKLAITVFILVSISLGIFIMRGAGK